MSRIMRLASSRRPKILYVFARLLCTTSKPAEADLRKIWTPELAVNEHFIAIQSLIRNARALEDRKDFMVLRSLAIKGRARVNKPPRRRVTTCYRIMEFLIKCDNGIAGHVLSFWDAPR